jgi:hypothetical protein
MIPTIVWDASGSAPNWQAAFRANEPPRAQLAQAQINAADVGAMRAGQHPRPHLVLTRL